jgi:hypothetical protein
VVHGGILAFEGGLGHMAGDEEHFTLEHVRLDSNDESGVEEIVNRHRSDVFGLKHVCVCRSRSMSTQLNHSSLCRLRDCSSSRARTSLGASIRSHSPFRVKRAFAPRDRVAGQWCS